MLFFNGTHMTEINSSKIIQNFRLLLQKGKTELFKIPYKNEELIYSLATLLHDNKNKPVQMFLTKEDFNQLYPLLNEALKWSDSYSLIVADEVLINDKLTKSMPYQTDSYFNETHPCLSSLAQNNNNIKIVQLKKNEQYYSFILTPNAHMIRFKDADAFGCCVNVRYNRKEIERMDNLRKLFQHLLERSIPFSSDLIDKHIIDFTNLFPRQRTYE